MAVKVRMTDNSNLVLNQMGGNVEAALDAMGTAAVGMIVRQMQDGYGKPIRQTGDLMRDVQYETIAGKQVTRVGSTLDYAPFVHDGTSRMPGRPYITDGLSGKSEKLGQAAAPHLQKGF